MYRYAHTKNRVHRVIVEGGKAFKVEQCNLDDVAFLHLDDAEPEGKHCAYCWAGWVEPTEVEKATEDAAAQEEKKAFTDQTAKPLALVTSTRRMAVAALAGAALFGAATGVLASPGDSNASPDVDDLRARLDALIVDVRVLSIDINDHVHEPAPAAATSAPVVIVVPTSAPVVPVVTAPPTAAPSQSAQPTQAPEGRVDTRTITNETRTETTRVVVITPPPDITPHVVPTPPPTAPPTAPPTPAPTPRPCIHPGVAGGVRDKCRWPQQP